MRGKRAPFNGMRGKREGEAEYAGYDTLGQVRYHNRVSGPYNDPSNYHTLSSLCELSIESKIFFTNVVWCGMLFEIIT